MKYLSSTNDESMQAYHPWRRYLARMTDISIYGLLWTALIVIGFRVNIVTRDSFWNIIDSFIAVAIMLFIEPILLSLFATTPGKAIFGLKITGPDGKHLSYREGRLRTWQVISRGMGYDLPFYNFVRLWESYRLCEDNKIQPWDQSISYTIKDTKAYRGVLYILTSGILLALLAAIIFSLQIPPNRGNLKLEEFVDNYNYYSDVLGLEYADEYLNRDGKWVERDFDGTGYIEVAYMKNPEFDFTIEDGYVTGLSFDVEVEDSEEWLISYTDYMIVSYLALVGAERELGLFSMKPIHIIEEIRSSKFTNFKISEFGLTAICDVEYRGYFDSHAGYLIPEDNVEQNYFKISFAVQNNESNNSINFK